MTRSIRTAGTASLCVASLSATLAYAGNIFFDEATVVDAQPVYATRFVPEQVQQCGYVESWSDAQVDPALLGDARSTSVDDDIVAALRSESGLRGSRQSTYRCRTVTQSAEKRELSGYRVRFRYEGHIYERQMAEDPGERIRVRVRVSAGEQHLLTHSVVTPAHSNHTTKRAAW
ncbi:MAG: hypothetical protein ACN4GT_02955 [Gammaproteobacteria bacterium]